jgi:glycosyltransferase involved in cell wall biosynthesis
VRTIPVCFSTAQGGAERYLQLLYPRLGRFDHDSRLVGSVPGWETTGLPITKVRLGAKWGGRATVKGVFRLPAERSRIDRVVKTLDADLFHVQFKREQIGMTNLLSRYGPVVWTEHGTFARTTEGRMLAHGYRHSAKRAAAIICVSDVVADDVRDIVGQDTRVEVVENAVDTHVLRPPTDAERRTAREALGLTELSEPVLAWVGQLHSGKLPRLAVAVGREFPGVTVIAGSGSESRAVQDAAEGTRVRILGYIPDPSVVYRAADVLLFTSAGVNEGYPTNSLLEAGAHGLPIVVNAASGAINAVAAAGAVETGDDPRELARAAADIVGGSSGQTARDWAIAHDIIPWTQRHDAIMRACCDSPQVA